ncbi:ATP-dependent RNA helicase HrpA [Thalassoroseus pseudoceratinae]|uniref:ATP-dependent RNA helicase HrpA n=1 Tax=Thalassoroseus pseudoceratinae TaxID=2713176 RepID=UPI001F10590F|nr:ATP-dependent RNA helicase HrpA [Thalassoroseus pseudoceratinae]
MPDTLPSIDELETGLRSVMQSERFRLRRRLDSIKKAQAAGKPFDRNLRRLAGEIEKSSELYKRRAERVPKVTYPEDLPISGMRETIANALKEHQVIVVCGETGSGKSTQLPKLCLDLGRGVGGMIGHTQPRRIAARSVAARVAEELGKPLGKEVGFKIRFADSTSPETYIKLMTDGILLAETQGDRFLDRYDTLIIDEAHERSLNIDFLLGYVKGLLPRRRDLKLIITSATIDADRYAEHFADSRGPAPIINVEGRTYPVETRYRPLITDEDTDNRDEPDPLQHLATAIDEVAREQPVGDILVFMPTERDIRDAAKQLRGHHVAGDSSNRKTEILPLYGRLSTAEQNRVFQKSDWRRIVIATNVAESSLTVPNVRYVVDTGTARISRYSSRSQVQRLPIEPVSQASADQRAGRCGRVGPGVCIRLYSEEDYLTRDRFTAPEIQRTNLASVILQTQALKLGAIEEFPFLDPPKPGAIRDGYKTLFELGAIDEENRLTPIGQQLARLPVDPRIGRMILAGHEERCLQNVLIIAAALEIQDPRDRPVEKQQAADQAHEKFQHEESDFLSLLKLWQFYHKLRDDLSKSRLRKACVQNFLNFNRLREWSETYQQLRRLVEDAGMKVGGRKDFRKKNKVGSEKRKNDDETGTELRLEAKDADAIHRALLTGLLSNVAYRGEEGHEYTGSGGTKFFLWPGSGVFGKKPKWVMAAELVETSQRYLRTVARINPDWIEPLAGHLVKKTYSEPHWSAKSGSAMAFEKVLLFGLTLVPRRRVRYGRIDAKLSRELFLQHALAEFDWETKHPFFKHNQELLTEVEKMQAKSRQGDLLLLPEERFEFFDQRVPNRVVDAPSFDKWYRKEVKKQPRLLFMAKSDLLRAGAEGVDEDEFPNAIEVGRMRLPLEYHLEPGTDDDGITLTVPQAGVNQLDPHRLGWLVPGLLQEKIVALIKSLPKNIRREFVPAPDTARAVLKELQFGQGDFVDAVATKLSRIAGEPIRRDLFDENRLPSHLKMNVRVVDDDGQSVASGRDLQTIRREVSADASAAMSATDDAVWSRDDLTEWNFGDIPAHLDVRRGGVAMRAYPTLIDRGQTVSLRLVDTPQKAARQLRGGLRRLFALQNAKKLKQQVDYLPDLGRLRMLASTLPGEAKLTHSLVDLLADRAFFGDEAVLPRAEAEFQKREKAGRNRISVAVQDLASLVKPILEQAQNVKAMLEDSVPSAWEFSLLDMHEQHEELLREGFWTSTPWPWLCQYPRYLRAMLFRRERLSDSDWQADQKKQANVRRYWEMYLERRQSHAQRNIYDPQLNAFRWMIEEYRVSVFAQKLGTAIPISPKRLDQQWSQVAP